MFDNVCKYLAETFSDDFASWLLGEPVTLTQMSPSELSVEPIRADALILLESATSILHIEFQTKPDATMGFRMLDYRTRMYRKFPEKQVRQVVMYLKPSTSEYVFETAFEIPGTRHEFEVIRLWEQPPEIFLQAPGLIPFAALSQTNNQQSVLQAAAAQIQEIDEIVVQRNVAASTSILAGLILEQALIQKVFRSELMRESVIYQDILAEGRNEGRNEGEQNLVLRLLTKRVGAIAPATESQIRSLSLAKLEELGEALLDFSEASELSVWLKQNQ